MFRAGVDHQTVPVRVVNEVESLLEVFPSSAAVDGRGRLSIGGCDVEALALQFGTPAFVVDVDMLRRRGLTFRTGLAARWPRSRVVFPCKAFPSVAVVRTLAREGLGCEVVGRGELAVALAAEVDPASIVMHGNAKADEDVAAAVDAGVGTIVIDGGDDIERLERLAPAGQRVLIRVIPDVRADTHEKVLTGHADSKFGLLPDAARIAIDRIERKGRLSLAGVHVHVGSQILDTWPFREAIGRIAALGRFAVYDLGGGLGVRYTPDGSAPSIEDYLDALVDGARRHLPSDAEIVIEPGRSLVAPTCVTLYRVVTVKRGRRILVAVDGGMADNMEVTLYGTRFQPTIATRFGPGTQVDVVGRHCESGDIVALGVSIADPAPGDVLVVPMTGAYCYSLANNYNGALKPPVVFVEEGRAELVVRRETYEEVLVRELTVRHG